MESTATHQGAAEQGAQPQSADVGGDDFASQMAALVGDDGSISSQPDRDDDSQLSDADGSDEAPDDWQADDATQDAEQNAKAADPEALVTVKVNGEEKAVKLADLVAHYQKGDASAKRFEEAAQQRKDVEAQRSQVQAERDALRQALTVYTSQLQALQQTQQPDWESLLKDDPAEYVRQRHYHDQRQQQLHQAQAAQAYLTKQQQAEAQNRAVQRLQSEAQALVEAIPEWKDAEKAKTGKQALRNMLQQSGFSDDEINGLHDHRAVALLHKAMKFDQLVAEQAKAKQATASKLNKLPPPRMERTGGGDNRPADGRTRAMQRLSSSGSVRDAAAAIASLL